jgi:hypothetical protein
MEDKQATQEAAIDFAAALSALVDTNKGTSILKPDALPAIKAMADRIRERWIARLED